MVLSAVLILAVAMLPAYGDRFPLVKDGVAAPVVIPADAEASTELAAAELADYVQKITGKRPELLTNDYARVPRIEIGTLNTMHGLPDTIVRRLNASDSWESHVVSCRNDVLRIVGRDEVAELYGTYQFLEEKLGVRWFKEWTVDDPGDFCPSSDTIEVAAFEKFRAPAFGFRWLNQTGASCSYCPKNGIAWTVRIGLQARPFRGSGYSAVDNLVRRHADKGDPKIVREIHETFKPRVPMRLLGLGGGHMTCLDAVPAKKYFKSHPEYFAEVKGERESKNGHYCISNPEVQRLVADDIISKFAKTGGRGRYLLGLQDGEHNLCECENCRALDDADARLLPLNSNISTRFHTMARNVAEMVYKRYPAADLRTWAYSVYRTPPVGVKLDPRTGAELCIHGRCYGHALDDPACERNPASLAWVRKWLKVVSHGSFYEYANCSRNYYCCLETVAARDFRLYRDLGILGWGEETGYADSMFLPAKPKGQFDERRAKNHTNWQWLYLVGKLTWDPDLDADAILDDAESKYYGAAYPAMKEYQRLRRTSWKNASVCWGYGGYPMTDERTRTVLNEPGLKDRLLSLLDRAERLAKGDEVRRYRVLKDREWLTRYWIEPNEKLRQNSNSTLRASATTGEIVVDGDASEPSWGRAGWAVEGVPEHMDVAALSDERGFYFLFRCLGTKESIGRDRVGVVLYPPDSDNTGKSYTFTADLETGARRTETGYVAELRADVGADRRLRRGEIWRVRFFRNPDGNEPDVRYPVEVGEPWLVNGSLDGVDENGKTRGWIFSGKNTKLVDLPGHQHAVKLGVILQLQCGLRSLGTKPHPRKVRVSFRAWGVGTVRVSLLRYKGQQRLMPNVLGGVYDVAGTPRHYSTVCEIPAGEWIGLCLEAVWGKGVTNDITVDDIAITLEEDVHPGK